MDGRSSMHFSAMCMLYKQYIIPPLPPSRRRLSNFTTHRLTQSYLHGESGRLLVVVVQQVGHEGGVVRQILAHPQPDGLAAELAVALRVLHMDGPSSWEQGEEEQEEDGAPYNRNSSSTAGRCFTSSSDGCLFLRVRHFSPQWLRLMTVSSPRHAGIVFF